MRRSDPDETEGRALYRARAESEVRVEDVCAGLARKVRSAQDPTP